MLLTYLFWPICVILFLVLGFLLGAYWIKKSYEQKLGDIKVLTDKMVQDAKRDAANIKKEAHLQGQDLVFKMKSECDKELTDKRSEVKRLEDRLSQKEESLDRRSEALTRRETEVAKSEVEVVKSEKLNADASKELHDLIRQEGEKLERLAQMTSQEAKELLLKNMEEAAKHEGGRLIRRAEAEAREIADKKSREILALAVKRYASDYVAEHTISVVNLPNEEMKGRIIGREGRNIRAIEATTGVDLIIDDTPEAVILSSFSPIRR